VEGMVGGACGALLDAGCKEIFDEKEEAVTIRQAVAKARLKELQYRLQQTAQKKRDTTKRGGKL